MVGRRGTRAVVDDLSSVRFELPLAPRVYVHRHAASIPLSLTLTAIGPNMLESSRELSCLSAVVVPRERGAGRAAVFPSHLHMLKKPPPPSVHAHRAGCKYTLAYVRFWSYCAAFKRPFGPDSITPFHRVDALFLCRRRATHDSDDLHSRC